MAFGQLGRMAALIGCVSCIAFSVPASASTVTTCPTGGSGVTISITTSVAATCGPSGNGNTLNGGASDPNVMAGLTTLDTTSSVGILTLTMTGTNSGTFSFTTTGYDNFALGFQTSAAAPKPDYFTFNLADGVTSGTWSISDSGTSLTLGLLYGDDPPTEAPLPGALPLFASGLGAMGLLLGRRKRKAAASAAA